MCCAAGHRSPIRCRLRAAAGRTIARGAVPGKRTKKNRIQYGYHRKEFFELKDAEAVCGRERSFTMFHASRGSLSLSRIVDNGGGWVGRGSDFIQRPI